MFRIEKTVEFDKWIRKLKDIRAKAKMLFRIQKLETDEHFGDCKPVSGGISEMRINYAKGYQSLFQRERKQDHHPFDRRREIKSTEGHKKGKGNLDSTKERFTWQQQNLILQTISTTKK